MTDHSVRPILSSSSVPPALPVPSFVPVGSKRGADDLCEVSLQGSARTKRACSAEPAG